MKLSRSFFYDALILVLCVAGFGMCIFLFLRDLNAAILRLDEQPVGIITYRYNTAQRRFVDRLIWDRLRNGSPVYNGDVIRTASLSEATITFEHGGIVEIFSNTLIQIFVDSLGSRIDFSGGGISVNTSSASSMVIASGDKRLTVDAGAVVQAASLEDGALNLAVSEGTAFLENIQDAETALAIEAGSGLLFDAEGETIALPQAVAISPRPGTRFLSPAEGLLVDFGWNRINYSSEGLTRLEIAYDRSFNRIYFSQETMDGNLGVILPEGTWFWRLYPITAPNAIASEASWEIPYSRITVTHSPVPTLISPRENQVFSYRSTPPSLRFQWTSSPQASLYILEAASNPSMQNPVLNLQVRSDTENLLSVPSSALEEGTWYWRVTPVYSRDFEGSPAPSVTQSFTIERGAPLASPVLTAPAEDSVINIGTGRRDIVFSWRRENEAVSYTVSISANSNMSSPVIERTLTDTFLRYGTEETIITPGIWYWTVRQIGHDGDVSAASQPRVFRVLQDEVIQRMIFPLDDYVVAESLLPDTRFTWRTNLENTHFQLSQNQEFTQLLVNEGAPFESFTVRSLQNGVYYWRVTGGDGTQQHESAGRRITVTGSLPPPELNPPGNAEELVDEDIIVRQGQSLDFNWQPSQDAEFYTFRLYREDDPESPVMETIVSGTNLAVNMSNHEGGSYTWSVQGMARESTSNSRRTGFVASQSINIRHLHPVFLQHPRGGIEYAGLDASRNPDTANWTSPEAAFDTMFLLARDAGMTDIVYSEADVSHSFVLPPLTEGDYYWIIQAQNEAGLDISSVVPSHFRVAPIPPLPTPQNRRPDNAYTITPAQIRHSRSVDFSWNRVQGANGYILTIFHGDGAQRRMVVQTPVLSETNYTVEDIRLLGRGDFYWHVEALYVIENGFIEQRGRLLENRFTVDIPSPQQIRTIDSGLLYGN